MPAIPHMNALSDVQREYLRSQLRYDHHDDPPPPNTLVVHERQHALIVGTVRRFAARQPMHMLDVGCGWGDFSDKLDPSLASYVGVEPSPVELRRFHRRPNRQLVRGVGECLDFLKDRSRNFILLNSVLDHCFDWRQTLAQCLRILTPGGLLIVSMENGQKLTVRLRRWLGLEHVHQGHLAFFGVSEMRALIEPEFDILEVRTIGFLFGMHAVTKRIPLPLSLLRAANRAADAFFHVAAPTGGHIFFLAARRKGALPDPAGCVQPFRCARCGADWIYGAGRCESCGANISLNEDGWLDTVAINETLRAQLDG